jgi:hypothetical protein
MGTWYFAACHDCREYVNLEKFVNWAGYANLGWTRTDARAYIDTLFGADRDDAFELRKWVKQSLALHMFMAAHNGHRLGVYAEAEWNPHEQPEKDWREVLEDWDE